MADFSDTFLQASSVTADEAILMNPLFEAASTLTGVWTVGSGSELFVQATTLRGTLRLDGNELAGGRYRR